MSRLHLIVHGRVQGVFFRATAQKLGEQLGLRGWVRNCADGSVEIVAEGDATLLEKLRAWAARGPDGASVERVQEIPEPETGEFRRFSVRG